MEGNPGRLRALEMDRRGKTAPAAWTLFGVGCGWLCSILLQQKTDGDGVNLHPVMLPSAGPAAKNPVHGGVRTPKTEPRSKTRGWNLQGVFAWERPNYTAGVAV